MSATVRDIREKKLVAVARYLDRFPPLAPGQKEEEVEQYYGLLCVELRRLPPPLGAKFTYTRSQLTEYGMATLRDESPSLLLLHDLQRRGLPLQDFVSCLQKIGCQRALNEFTSATPPEFTQHPQSQSLLEGEELRLECQSRCKPGQPSFLWFRRRDAQSDWEPVIDSFSNILVIEEVNLAHGGHYICRVTNPHINDPQRANVFCGEVTVKVHSREIEQKTPIRQETAGDLDPPPFPPIITSHPKPVEVEYGQPVFMECRATGHDITYDWFRGGQYVRSSSGRIEFPHVRLEHAGIYQCKMTNPQGGTVMSNTASLRVVPVIVIDQQPPKSMQGYKNDTISLECSASSKRGPVTYQWFRSRKLITGAIDRVYSTKTPGSYYCQVGLRDHREQIPMISSTTRVSINNIKITVQPHNVHGGTGECVSLYCQADIIPPVSSKKKIEYLWLMSSSKDGKKEPLQKALRPQQSEGTLLFGQLNIDHRGYYVCQACLDKEFVESEEVHLSVTMAGTPSPPKVTILRHPVSWVVKPGENFKMSCRAIATPDQPLLYQWMRDNEPIPNATGPELTGEGVSDSAATYHCDVRAGGGVVVQSHSAYTHQAPPDPPPAKGQHNHQQAEAEEILSTLSGQRYARDKVALLIGNQRYSGCEKLNNLKCIEQEVASVAQKLRDLDFKVFVFVNLGLVEMKQVLNWFYSLLPPGVYGLFYYSGHGFHVANTSYLMPVDITSAYPDANNCIGSNSIAHHMQKTRCRAVLVLDCCRVIQEDNSHRATTPYPSLGTANIVEIHSTSLGKAAYDGSAFTQSFIEALDTNKDVSHLLTDVLNKVREKCDNATPWMNGSMLGGICLKDPIMRDSMRADEKAEKVWDCADAIHSVCDPVVLEGSSSLAKLLSLRLAFSAPFTNILSVKMEANLKQLGITASIQLSKVESMTSQGVEVEAEENHNNSLSQCVTIRNIQRMTKPLSLCVGVTVRGDGDCGDVQCEEMNHSLSQPLLSHLLHPIS